MYFWWFSTYTMVTITWNLLLPHTDGAVPTSTGTLKDTKITNMLLLSSRYPLLWAQNRKLWFTLNDVFVLNFNKIPKIDRFSNHSTNSKDKQGVMKIKSIPYTTFYIQKCKTITKWSKSKSSVLFVTIL